MAHLPKDVSFSAIHAGEWVDVLVTWSRTNISLRVIVFWDKRHREKGYLLTNLTSQTFSAEHVLDLYGLRWQVELMFKEWKSTMG